jgi:hypothetical protein
LAALVLPVVVATAAGDKEPLSQLLLGLIGLGVGWIIGVFAARHPIAEEVLLLLAQVRPLWRRRGASPVR